MEDELALQQVETQLREHGFELYCADSVVAARLHIVARMRQRGIKTFLGWPPSDIGIDGLAEALNEVGIQWIIPQDERWWENRPYEADVRTVALVRAHGAWLARGALWFPWDERRALGVVIFPAELVVVLFLEDVFSTWHEWLDRWRTDEGVFIPDGAFLSGTRRPYFLSGERMRAGLGAMKAHVVLVSS